MARRNKRDQGERQDKQLKGEKSVSWLILPALDAYSWMERCGVVDCVVVID